MTDNCTINEQELDKHLKNLCYNLTSGWPYAPIRCRNELKRKAFEMVHWTFPGGAYLGFEVAAEP